jgi:Zn2+/Cd2+-exporting ATPase
MSPSPTTATPEEVAELIFDVEGMDCASCARSLERGVGALAGVEGCDVDFTSARLRTTGRVDPDLVMRRAEELGYRARPRGEGRRPGAPAVAERTSLLSFLLERRETRLALAGGVLLLPGLVFHEILGVESHWLDVPALLALLLAGAPVVRTAWRGIRVNRELNIQALMTVAAVGAVVIGAWVEAGMVIVLFALGEALEGFAAQRARSAIRGLMTVAPPRAHRLRRADGVVAPEESVPVEALVPGDVILVRPGERIAMDGEVEAGHSNVDQSVLTGEALPVGRDPGDPVLAGSVNGEGVLEVRVTHGVQDTLLHRMIRMVEEAQARRAPVQRFLDRFARVYTPAVVALAMVVAVVPPLVFGAPFWNPDPDTFGWLYRALALLVVACPCALVISVPASVVSGLTNAARQGVLIKGGAHLEALAGVRAVAFDKTGTLTEGALSVVRVRSVACAGGAAENAGQDRCDACEDLLAVAAAVERRSEHPVGRAVAAEAEARGLGARIPEATHHRALAGRGMEARLRGRPVTVGSHRHFDQNVPHDGVHCRLAAADAVEGRTPILVELDGEYLGTITLADTPRPSAVAAVDELRSLGLHTLLLSGDSRGAVDSLARSIHVDECRAELLPAEKVRAVETLQERLGPVAMVGDGINDAPALAAAAVGIAVGGDLGGTDQAQETAGITLMRDDLRAIPRTVRLARATMRTVRANVAFAIGIKVVFLVLVLAGMGTLWMAVLADVGATLLVTLNGMRLLRWDGAGDVP